MHSRSARAPRRVAARFGAVRCLYCGAFTAAPLLWRLYCGAFIAAYHCGAFRRVALQRAAVHSMVVPFAAAFFALHCGVLRRIAAYCSAERWASRRNTQYRSALRIAAPFAAQYRSASRGGKSHCFSPRRIAAHRAEYIAARSAAVWCKAYCSAFRSALRRDGVLQWYCGAVQTHALGDAALLPCRPTEAVAAHCSCCGSLLVFAAHCWCLRLIAGVAAYCSCCGSLLVLRLIAGVALLLRLVAASTNRAAPLLLLELHSNSNSCSVMIVNANNNTMI